MPNKISNDEIAKLLRELAAVLEALGDNVFKIRAYKNAADVVEFLDEPLVSIWEKGDLEKVQGIGKAIAEKLGDIFATGRSEEVEQIKSRVSPAMFTLLPIEGLGPKKAYRLTEEFKLTNANTVLEDLQKIIQDDKISKLEGFGAKSQEVIRKALENYSPDQEKRMRIDQADIIADEIVQYLKQCSAIEQVSPLGSLRRRKSTIGDIDLGVSTEDPKAVIDHVEAYNKVKQILVSGGELVRFIHISGENVDVKIVQPKMWGSLLQHFTGSKQHNVALRERALSMGLSLSEHGIKKVDKPQASLSDKEKSQQKLQTYKEEQSFYKALDLDWVPPELRENTGEIELADSSKLPVLITLADIRGDFHTHTNYEWASSHDYGQNSPEDLIKKGIGLGYEYIGIGDHNPSASGQSPKMITKSIQDRVQNINNTAENYKSTIKVFNTLEVDIKPDGELALNREACELLDFVIVSVHSSMQLDKKTMTKRVLKALQYPNVKIIGHPTARLINKRLGFELEWKEIFEACREKNIALEINANPNRLDLNETLVKQAIEAKVKLVINTDTHAVENMDYMRYGIDVARRGWATKESIVNTWETSDLLKWLKL